MEILFADDMMTEIINLLELEELRNLFFAFSFLKRRWLEKLKLKYREWRSFIAGNFICAKNTILGLTNDLDTRGFNDLDLEFYLIKRILFGFVNPEYLTIRSDKVNDVHLGYTLSRVLKNDLSPTEKKIYDRIYGRKIQK